MKTFSAKKLYEDRDTGEILRFAYALDSASFNSELLKKAGFVISNERELESFIKGYNPVGNFHRVPLEMFVQVVPFDPSRIGNSQIQVI